MSKFLIKKGNGLNIHDDELKKYDKKDLCYILDINPECCFEKEKALKNTLIQSIHEVSFDVSNINKLSLVNSKELFRLLIILNKYPADIIDRILALNLPINKLNFILTDFDEKFALLNSFDEEMLIFILVSKKLKACAEKDEMIDNILLNFSLDELKNIMDKYDKTDFNDYIFVKDLNILMLNAILFSNNLPLYVNNRKYKISSLCYYFSSDELKSIISDINDKIELLDCLPDLKLILMLNINNFRHYRKHDSNVLMIVKNFSLSKIKSDLSLLNLLNPLPNNILNEILKLNLNIEEFKKYANDLINKFGLLKDFNEDKLIYILVSKNLEESNDKNAMIAIILFNYSYNELKFLIDDLNKINFDSYDFLNYLNPNKLNILLYSNNLHQYSYRKYKIAAVCLNIPLPQLKNNIDQINKELDLLEDLPIELLNMILSKNGLSIKGTKKDRVGRICCNLSFEDINYEINSPEFKHSKKELEIQNQRRKRAEIPVGIDFGNRNKFFR